MHVLVGRIYAHLSPLSLPRKNSRLRLGHIRLKCLANKNVSSPRRALFSQMCVETFSRSSACARALKFALFQPLGGCVRFHPSRCRVLCQQRCFSSCPPVTFLWPIPILQIRFTPAETSRLPPCSGVSSVSLGVLQ